MDKDIQTPPFSLTPECPDAVETTNRKRKRPEEDDAVLEEREGEEEPLENGAAAAPPPPPPTSEGVGKENVERENPKAKGGAEGDYRGSRPPEDDCCPICFGEFSAPCRANCRHWFCGGCILQYWNYSAASRPCKCPMCAAAITQLTPDASLLELRGDDEVGKVLESVDRYNRLYVGGLRGLVQKFWESPLFIKKIFQQMMDPDRPDTYLHEMRLVAMILSIFYAATPFDFIPTGGLGVFRMFDYAAIVIVLVLRVVGIFRRRRLTQRVRHLAAAQPLVNEPPRI